MKLCLPSYRAWTVAILLMALVVPRCLMASNMTVMEDQQAPCHGMQEDAGVAQAVSLVTCAQQCEQSVVNSLLVKKPDLKQLDYSPVAIVSAKISTLLASISTALHQGWPPDNQFLLSSTSNLYLDTGRLRL